MDKNKSTTNLNQAGIYSITNTVNDRVYIGRAKDIRKRWSTHLRELNQGIHKNTELQEDWLIYGQDKFKFEVVEFVSSDEINQLELDYILLNAVNGYNVLNYKDTIKGYLMNEMVFNGFKVVIDYKTLDCTSPLGKPLTFSVLIEKNNYKCLVDLYSRDFEADKTHENIKKAYGSFHMNKLIRISYSGADKVNYDELDDILTKLYDDCYSWFRKNNIKVD
jgi:group I intron endonuclease